MTSSAPLLRVAAVAAAVTALAGCSFQGSADDPDASGSARPSVSSSAPSSPSSSSSAAGGSSASAPASSGSSASTRPAGSTAPGSGSGGGGVDRCHTSELTGSLLPGDPGAGQRHATLVLTDTGGQTCTIDGYGGLGLVDAAGKALPTKQVRTGSAPKPVTLRPGAKVTAQLQWGAVPGTGDGPTGDCQPTAAALQVIPPDETDPLRVAWQGGPVCEGGTIRQTAYVAG
ncbi:DUF4232 domain-containing protein [Modestobacter sp. NPDC049651]|uniref:DUF4232 domain-containing protein n=1 Tax=unclassified Modestobacter TaxID=2643866 RepID=UPI0033C99B6B